MTDDAGTRYEYGARDLRIEDGDGAQVSIGRVGDALVIRAPYSVYIEDAREFIERVAQLAGLRVAQPADPEMVVGKWEPVPTQPVGHVQVKVAEGEPKRPHDFAFEVAPRIRAIKVTEEYARSGIFNSTSKVAPKFDERRGTLLGVEVRGEDGEMTGRVAQVGDYLVFTPTDVEVVWGHVFEDNYREVGG